MKLLGLKKYIQRIPSSRPKDAEENRRISSLQIVRILLAIAVTLILTQVLNIKFSAEILSLAAVLGILSSVKLLRRGWPFSWALLLHIAIYFSMRFFFWEWNALSDPKNATADFHVALLADSALLVYIWFTAAFFSTWLYWCREWAVTVEGTLSCALFIWLMGGHRNYHLDAPKQVSSLSWKLPLLQRFHVEPQHLFLILAAIATVILAIYFVISSKRPLFRGDIVERSPGQRRIIFATCLLFLSLAALVTYTAYVNRQYATGITRATQGVGMTKPGKEGESNLGFHSAMGATKQPAALVRLEGDYSKNPHAPMLYFREGALSQFNGREYVLAPPPFDLDVPHIRPGQPYIADNETLSPVFSEEFFEALPSFFDESTPFHYEPPGSRMRLRSPEFAFFFGKKDLEFRFEQEISPLTFRAFSREFPFEALPSDDFSYVTGPSLGLSVFHEIILPEIIFQFPPPVPTFKRQKLVQSVFLLLDHNAPFAVDYPSRIGLIKNPDPNRFTVSYQAISQAPTVKNEILINNLVGNPLWTREVKEHYLQAPGSRSLLSSDLPFDLETKDSKVKLDTYGEDLRYLAMAKRLTEGAETPIEKANAIVKYLSEKSVYTRQPGHTLDERGDPVSPYLFAEKKRGYCVHFAHAAVFLFRLVGIPARIGTGYLTDLQYAKDGHILLSLADRHAWPEIYIDGYGWTVFDVNPAEAENEQAPVPDSKMLEELMNKLDGLGQVTPPEEKSEVSETENDSVFTALLNLRLFLFLGSTLLLCFFSLKLWLRFGYLLVFSPRDKIRRSYSSFASQMFDLGLGRDPGETRVEHGQRLERGLKIEADSIAKLLQETTYGENSAPADIATIEQARRSFQQSLKGKVPWWKRVIAFFNPSSVTRFRRW